MSGNRAGGPVVVRWWWAPATAVIATVGGALLLILEALLGYVWPQSLRLLLPAHIGGATVVSTLLAMFALRRSVRRYMDRSNPFWPGVGYGLLAAMATAAIAGLLGAPSVAQVLPAIGSSLTFAALTLEFPVMCLLGAVTWAGLAARRSPASP